MTVFLVTTGDGSDGSEWQVQGIFSTEEKAEAFKAAYEQPRFNGDGTSYVLTAEVEEWDVDPPYHPDQNQNRIPR